MNHPMKIAELLREIASFIEDPRCLSSLSQVDRFTRAAVMPCLFKNIEVSLDSVDSLAVALRKNPDSAVSCRSLSFCKRRSVRPVLRDSTEDSTSDDNSSQAGDFVGESEPIDANDSEDSDPNNSNAEDSHLDEGDSDSDENESDSDENESDYDENESDSDENESDLYETGVDVSHYEQLCTDLITVFNGISTHTALVSLRWWDWTDWTCNYPNVMLREDVWDAIASVLSSLQELDIYIPSTLDKEGWQAITETRYSQLRVLQLSMRSAHGTDCSQLQSMLDALSDLEELSLVFPHCCGPRGLTFGSNHPRLRRFSLTGSVHIPESDFLVRHLQLESIFLETLQSFSSTESSRKMLRALNITPYSLAHSPALINPQISHLSLRGIDEDMSGFVNAVRATRNSLRWLEIDIIILREYSHPLPPYAVDLLLSVGALDELAITHVCHPSPLPQTWSSDMLTIVLDAIGAITSLRALRFRCTQYLPQERLRDIGLLPPFLKYIGWDYDSQGPSSGPASSSVYVIEKQEGKNAVGRTLTRATTDDWMATGVLEFMGESWTP